MKVLLDTHVWIWWLLGSEKLSPQEKRSIDRLAAAGNLHLCAISLWEAQMLHAKQRLTLDLPFESWLRQASSPEIIDVPPLDAEVVIALHGLPESFHGDPADRLIVATGLVHGLKLATHDKVIRSSGAIPIWKGTS